MVKNWYRCTYIVLMKMNRFRINNFRVGSDLCEQGIYFIFLVAFCILVRVVDIVLTVGGRRFRGEVCHGNLEGHAPLFKAIFLPPNPLLMSLIKM